MEAELEPHEFFASGVGKHDGDEFAEFNGIARSTYEKWSRKPASDEEPGNTGLINPIRRVDKIFDWFLLHNPSMATSLVQRYLRKLRRHREIQSIQPLRPAEYRSLLSKVIDEDKDVIKALVEGAPLAVVRKELGEYMDKIDELMARLEASEGGVVELQVPDHRRAS